jgi:hypothetical protein
VLVGNYIVLGGTMTDEKRMTYAVYGKRSFRDALKLIASRRNSSMSKLIHEAIISQYGKEISEVEKIFASDYSEKN